MPYKRGYKKNRRRKKQNPNYVRVPGTIMPDTAYVSLRYQEQLVHKPVEVDELISFYGNALFDPDLTAGSGQPAGFPQWMGFFFKYQVVYSKIQVTVTNFIDQPMRISVQPKFTTGGSTINSGEQRYNRQMTIGVPENAQSTRTMTNSMNTRKLFGSSVAEQSYEGTISTNPTTTWVWSIRASAIGIPLLQDLNYSLTVKILYRVKFSERRFALAT